MKQFTRLSVLALATFWAAGAMAQDWTFYNPDNIKHQGTQTDHTIVVKVRTAPTLADINNDGKLEMIYGGQNDGDWDWFWQQWEEDGEQKEGWKYNWHWKWENTSYVIGFNGWDGDPERLDGNDDYWKTESDVYGMPSGTNNFYRWIDFDNDGNLDLIMLAKKDYDNHGLADGQDYYALIYRNGGAEAGYKFSKVDKAPFNIVDGVAGFNPYAGYWDHDRMGRYVRGISFGDVNNDGIMDFVCCNYEEQLSVFLGNGDGSFTKKVQLDGAYREGDVKVADLDGDGNLDIVCAAWNGSGLNAVNFYKGNGDGTFENKTPEGVRGQRGGSVAIADFNNDGKLDVFVFGYSDSVGFWIGDIFLNKGDFTFEPGPNYYTYNHNDADWTHCLSWGDDNKMWWADGTTAYAFDVDNDGNVDILMNYNENLILFRGNGDGSFKKGSWCNNKQSGDKAGGGFSFGDVYGRNMLDQAICYKQGDNAHIAIIPGRTGEDGNGELNQAPTAPENVKAVREGDKVIVTWDASTDDKTPQASLQYNLYVKYGQTVRMLIPAIEETGRLKVVQDMQTLPMGTTYTLTVPEDVENEDLEIGVQAIDGVFAPSAFTKAEITEASAEQVVTFDFVANEWDHVLGAGTTPDEACNLTEPLVKDGISIYFAQGEHKQYMPRYWNGPQVRVYTGNYMTFVAPEGKAITKIVFTAKSDKNFGLEPVIGTLEDKTWTGNGYDVRFIGTATNYLLTATVTLADANADTTTGISESVVRREVKATDIYNLQGQRVGQPQQKGLYIIGGKKVLR